MVTQHNAHVVAVVIEPPQCFKIAGSSVHQVPNTPQPVFVVIELDFLQQSLERFETAMNMADDVCAHGTGTGEVRAQCEGFRKGFKGLN